MVEQARPATDLEVKLLATGGSREALLRTSLDVLMYHAQLRWGANPLLEETDGGLVLEAHVVGQQPRAQATAEWLCTQWAQDVAAAPMQVQVGPMPSRSLSPFRPMPLPPRFDTTPMEHTADEGFVVHARDRWDVYCAAAEALGQLAVEQDDVVPLQWIPLRLHAPNPDEDTWEEDERLFAWLSEVLFHLEARRFALRHAVITHADATHLVGWILGEELDPGRHQVHGSIKAITYHAMRIAPCTDGSWEAAVIVDV